MVNADPAAHVSSAVSLLAKRAQTLREGLAVLAQPLKELRAEPTPASGIPEFPELVNQLLERTEVASALGPLPWVVRTQLAGLGCVSAAHVALLTGEDVHRLTLTWAEETLVNDAIERVVSLLRQVDAGVFDEMPFMGVVRAALRRTVLFASSGERSLSKQQCASTLTPGVEQSQTVLFTSAGESSLSNQQCNFALAPGCQRSLQGLMVPGMSLEAAITDQADAEAHGDCPHAPTRSAIGNSILPEARQWTTAAAVELATDDFELASRAAVEVTCTTDIAAGASQYNTRHAGITTYLSENQLGSQRGSSGSAIEVAADESPLFLSLSIESCHPKPISSDTRHFRISSDSSGGSADLSESLRGPSQGLSAGEEDDMTTDKDWPHASAQGAAFAEFSRDGPSQQTQLADSELCPVAEPLTGGRWSSAASVLGLENANTANDEVPSGVASGCGDYSDWATSGNIEDLQSEFSEVEETELEEPALLGNRLGEFLSF